MARREARPVWRLTVRLRGVMPIVWRAILVRPETKLAMLHRYMQAAMGWCVCHLFEFTINGRRYGIPDPQWPSETTTYDARRYTLERIFAQLPAHCEYLYDSATAGSTASTSKVPKRPSFVNSTRSAWPAPSRARPKIAAAQMATVSSSPC